uniref:Uncharacterized protein n=1 Tax=Plectus sambesii TaxID=2011161 RepID=A0A914UQT2_9BILA
MRRAPVQRVDGGRFDRHCTVGQRAARLGGRGIEPPPGGGQRRTAPRSTALRCRRRTNRPSADGHSHPPAMEFATAESALQCGLTDSDDCNAAATASAADVSDNNTVPPVRGVCISR